MKTSFSLPPSLESNFLFDRIHGGWLGRAAGCVLGKPVEMGWDKTKMDAYLERAGCIPLTDYIVRLDPMPPGFAMNPGGRGCCRGEVHGAPPDDDTDYTILGLHILETYGLDFSTENVAAEWLDHLPYHRTWTAERTTYRNLILGLPARTAGQFLNFERAYIGARIRVDAYGMALPGNPALAAELARRDARLSHTGEGVYSAMFMAACIAEAFVTADMEAVLRAGLGVTPTESITAASIRETLAEHARTADWQTAYERLLARYGSYHPVHAINNTVCMAIAMLYGEGDFEKTICIAVRCGLDTDCNAANAGTVLGILTGARALPAQWIAPLEDALYASVAEFGRMSISELARRTTELAVRFQPQLTKKE